MKAPVFKVALIFWSLLIGFYPLEASAQRHLRKIVRLTWYSQSNIEKVQAGDTVELASVQSLLSKNPKTHWSFRKGKYYRFVSNHLPVENKPKKWKVHAQGGEKFITMKLGVQKEVYRVVGFDFIELRGTMLILVKVE